LFGDESYSRVSKKTLAREKYIERKTKSLLVSLFYQRLSAAIGSPFSKMCFFQARL